MMGLASVVVGGASAVGSGIAAAREQRQAVEYADALARATRHARFLETLALEAMEQIASLEAKVRTLEAACRQRQEHIETMKARLHG
jgi:phage shock protein A